MDFLSPELYLHQTKRLTFDDVYVISNKFDNILIIQAFDAYMSQGKYNKERIQWH